MAGWDGAGSIHAIRLRLTKLDATGAPLVGQASMLVTDALVLVNFTPEMRQGTEIEVVNGADDLCVYYRAPDKLKSATANLQVCTPDPYVAEFLAGGTVLLNGEAVAGYAAPVVGADPVPNGVSVEVWSHAVLDGDIDPDEPYIHWVYPKSKWVQQQLEKNATTAAQPQFTGRMYPNQNWGEGPVGDWQFTSNRLWQYARASTVPAVTDGPVEITES